MATITIPPDNKNPITLGNGDTLTVNTGGTSKNITINDGATETVNTGGKALNTTVNDGGTLTVNTGGTIDQTTINGGSVQLFHATADHTTINFSLAFPTSEVDAFNGSVVKNTVITGGSVFSVQHGLLLDATSRAENVEFRAPANPKAGAGAALGVDNPLNLTGDIKGLSVSDIIQFGGLSANSITVTSFEVTKTNELIITYNDATHTGLHATYHLQAMQPHTTFELIQGDLGGLHYTRLTVVAEKTVGNHKVAFESASIHSTDLVSLVGVAHEHGHGHAADALL